MAPRGSRGGAAALGDDEQMDNAFSAASPRVDGVAARCPVGGDRASVDTRRSGRNVIHPSTRRVDDNSKYLKILIHEPSARRASTRPAGLDGASIAGSARVGLRTFLFLTSSSPPMSTSVRTFLRGLDDPPHSAWSHAPRAAGHRLLPPP